MKTLKKILIGLLVLLVLLVALGIYLPKDLQVSESKEMSVSPSYIYQLVNDHAVAHQWNPWVKGDTSMVLTMGEKTRGVGGTYSWSSETMGQGTSTFVEMVPNQKVKSEIYFDGNGPNHYTFDLEDKGDKTNVTWTMDTHLGFPMNLTRWFFKRMISKSYKEGLSNLEEVALERKNKGVYNGIQVTETEVPAKYYVMNRAEVSMENVQKFYSQNLGPIFARVQKEGITMAGMPSGLFFKWDQANNKTDMAVAVPVMEEVDIQDLSSISLQPSNVVEVLYQGDFANTQEAHEAIDAYMLDRGILYNAPIIEEYVTDPTQEPDPTKWQTRILYYFDK